MALLAESLVEEWLNRQGFFTIRGIKHGVDEIDILAVRHAETGLEAWHVEVQASFRPIGYISKLPKTIADKSGKGRTSAVKRSPKLLKECVDGWVETKFLSDKKVRARERAWPGLSWQHYLVHAVARDNSELALIAKHGVGLIPFHAVLHGLCQEAVTDFKGAAGSDIAEMIEYYSTR